MSDRPNKKIRNQRSVPNFVYIGFYFLTVLTALSGLAAIGWQAVDGQVLPTFLEWSIVLAMTVLGLLGFQFIRVARIWGQLGPAIQKREQRRNNIEAALVTRGFNEIFVYLIACQIALVAIIFVAVNEAHIGEIEFSIAAKNEPINVVQVYVLLGLLLASYIPALFGSLLIARAETRRRRIKLFRSDVVSPLTFAIATVSVLAIGTLAWAAGGRLFKIEDNFGVFVTLIVIAAFLAVITAPIVAKSLRDRREAAALIAAEAKVAGVPAISPAAWYSWLDSILVRLVAPLSGATQQRMPHLFVILIIVPLSALGYALPSPFGLVPLAFAIVLAISLGRRWAWVEADRETASRLERQNTREIHIGFDNDLKDEALLGYAMLFILVPLCLFQLQGVTGAFEYNADLASGNAFIDWSRFFGAELAKAVPFVDWWEVYNIDIERPYEPSDSSSLGMHLTFASRAVVDLVLLAALLQAFGIWQRNRAQRRLYAIGHLNAFDPFTEREFFEEGMRSDGNGGFEPRATFVRKVKEHYDRSRSHHPQALPYSQQRLSELVHSPNRELQAGAKWMVERFRVLAGEPDEQLNQIQEQISVAQLEQMAGNANPGDRGRLIDIKSNLERVIQKLQEQPKLVRESEIGRLTEILKDIKRIPELAFAYTLILELLGKRPQELAALILSAHVVQDSHTPFLPNVSERLRTRFPIRLNLFAGHVELRFRAYDAMLSQKNLDGVPAITRTTIDEVCRLMTNPDHGDKSEKGRERALRVLSS